VADMRLPHLPRVVAAEAHAGPVNDVSGAGRAASPSQNRSGND
jgi:hypothetical protein